VEPTAERKPGFHRAGLDGLAQRRRKRTVLGQDGPERRLRANRPGVHELQAGERLRRAIPLLFALLGLATAIRRRREEPEASAAGSHGAPCAPWRCCWHSANSSCCTSR
jgi:hypothetical protein